MFSERIRFLKTKMFCWKKDKYMLTLKKLIKKKTHEEL